MHRDTARRRPRNPRAVLLISVLATALAVIDPIVGVINVVILYHHGSDGRCHIDSGARPIHVAHASSQGAQEHSTYDAFNLVGFDEKSFVIYGIENNP